MLATLFLKVFCCKRYTMRQQVGKGLLTPSCTHVQYDISITTNADNDQPAHKCNIFLVHIF